jgi:hypothetical protein
MRDPGCVFCKIVAGELPARFIYADETVVSFLDIAPATPVMRLSFRDSTGVTYGKSKKMS